MKDSLVDNKYTFTIEEDTAIAVTFKDIESTDTAKVNNAEDFKTALANEDIKTIELTGDFTLTEALAINREVTIDGKGKTITGPSTTEKVKENGIVVSADKVTIKDLTVKDSKGYNIQVYNAKNVALNNVTLSNAKKGGLLVNASEVIVNKITTSENIWGGIEVSKGEGTNLENPKLTVQGTNSHTSPSTGITPAIWIDGKDTNDGWVSATGYTEMANPDTSKTQYFFFDKDEYKAAAEEALKEAATQAKDYKYDPAYNYGYKKLNVEGTTVAVAYNKSQFTDENSYKVVMDDMARYLGALYRFDDGETVKTIEYKGKDYTWNGTLKGSNWKNNESETLVSVITAEFQSNPTAFDQIGIVLKDANGQSVNLTLKLVLED